MFTKNWYKAMGARITNKVDSYKSLTGATKTMNNPYLAYYDELVSSPTGNASALPNMHRVLASADSYGGVILGTGTTPPTKDDYCLSGEIITGFAVSAGFNNLIDDNGCTIEAIYTLTNTSGADFTVGEIGLIANPSGTSSAKADKALYERTVIEPPITVPAGGVGVINYKIRMNYPA